MDFYVILGLDRTASVDDVGRAYRRLARRYHPGINPGDGEAAAFFRSVTEAYETLRDPERRRAYDTHGVGPAAPAPASIEFQGFDFSPGGVGLGASATFEELFADVRPAGADDAPARGSDLFGDITLAFEEAVRGAERKLTVSRLDACPACGGSGRRRGAARRCGACQGAGATRRRRGHMVFSMRCAACAGTGRVRSHGCAACRERGLVPRDEAITIQVPAGVDDGTRLRIEARGNAGRRGGPPGDLYITTRVGRHRVLRREGRDLHLELPIAVHEAALGAAVDVPTLDGATSLRVPPGTQSGQRFRLASRGVPSPRGAGGRGDLVVTVRVVLPPAADARARTLLRELGRIQSADLRKELFDD